MIVITKGIVPDSSPQWPVGSVFSCGKCSSRFEIEAGDPFRQTIERRPDGKNTMTIPCPTCGDIVGATKPRLMDMPKNWGKDVAQLT